MGSLVGETATLPTVGEPINIPPRRFNPIKTKQIQAEIDKMKAMGVIGPCENNHGWNSPIHPVPKPDGRLRLTVDFSHSLNKRLTQLDPYPQPSIDAVLNQIPPNAKYFTSVDLLHGYWQINLDPADQYKTAFYWGEECL